MNTHTLVPIRHLTDDVLLARVRQLARDERRTTVALIAHLAELDRRRLYLARGYASLFTYCTGELYLSEHAAYGRIEAARAAARFPIILELLEDGSITLTTVCLLSALLTGENHREVLAAAAHKSKREVEELVARLRPLPPVPSLVRRLPARGVEAQASSAAAPCPLSSTGMEHHDSTSNGEATFILGPRDGADHSESTRLPSRRAVIAPLAPERYKVQFTASAEMYAKLRQAQALLRHQIPDGDAAAVFDRALSVLLESLRRQKHAATRRAPGPAKAQADAVHEGGADRAQPSRLERNKSAPRGPSRYIPAAVKRDVWQRDGGRCAFVGAGSRRCEEEAFLEFHHIMPYSLGGEATVENIELRCRAHNGYEAERALGRWTPGTGVGARSGPS